MVYNVQCKSCDYDETWECSLEDYENNIKNPCPNCGGELFQNMNHEFNFILKGYGWTVKGKGCQGSCRYKKGSQEDLDDALRENDYLAEKGKADEIKRADDKANKAGL